MEKNTKHKLLGIVVIFAIVILLLPFLQSGKNLPSEPAPIKTPPFPEHHTAPNNHSAGDEVMPLENKIRMNRPSIVTNQKIKPNANRLVPLKEKVWVIQMGNFKDKDHALRLVDQLRENGYRAFIQQTTTAFGNHTRVYVGPENQKASANALAVRLENEVHIHGIVISYQPLAL